MSYEPELGQMMFGQPHKEHECPDIMIAALQYLRRQLEMHLWNINQKEMDPFQSGESFSNDVFEVQGYSWSDDEQPYNFKWRDLEVSWYKHLGRGTSANREVTPEIAAECLADCMRSVPL